MILADAFVLEASARCDQRVEELITMPRGLLIDTQLNTIADQVFKNRGYFAEHPLTKTYW